MILYDIIKLLTVDGDDSTFRSRDNRFGKTSKKSDTIRYYHHHHYQTINSVKTIKRQRNYVVDGKMKLFNAILDALFVVVEVVFVVVVNNISNKNKNKNLLKIDFTIV